MHVASLRDMQHATKRSASATHHATDLQQRCPQVVLDTHSLQHGMQQRCNRIHLLLQSLKNRRTPNPRKKMETPQTLAKRDNQQDSVKEKAVAHLVRELTPVEHQCIEKMEERKKTKSFKDFCKTNDAGRIVTFFKEGLSEKDAMEDFNARLSEATGCAYEGHRLLAQSARVLCKSDAKVEELVSKLNEVGLFLVELEPRDALEGILCMQIVVTHQKWIDLLKKAECQKNSEQAKMFFNTADKLLSRCQSSMQSLISYRKGGQQKVTVEHVSVAPGAQAAIGVFSTGGGGGQKENLRGTL